MLDWVYCLRKLLIMSTEPTQETASTENAQAASSAKRAAPSKRTALIAGAVLLALVIAGGAYMYRSGKLPTFFAGALGGDSTSREVVAKVDGVEITRGELDKRVAQANKVQGNPADAPADMMLEQQVLDELVNMQLVLNVAQKSGISVNDEQVDNEISSIVTSMGGEETFEQQLALVGMTRDELRDSLRRDLTAREVLNANTDMENVQVSDEDVRKMYDEQVAGQEGAPAFEQVADAIRQQLVQQQSGALVSAYLEELRSKADVQILI